jgi:hypothetical protein
MKKDIYSGYNKEDWHILKKAALDASGTDSKGKHHVFDNLPEHLRSSEVGDLIYKAVYLGHKRAADKAANILTNGAEHAWLILAKS